MNTELILDSVGNIDDELINSVQTLRSKPQKHFLRRKLLIPAACIVLVLGLALTAEASYGTVSNLLSPLFSGSQTEIVDKIGIPAGASSSSDGYTLTADAIIGDRYNTVIVYTLTRDNGLPIEADACFSNWESNILSNNAGSGSLESVKSEDGTSVHFIESWSSSSPLIGRVVTVSFSGLCDFRGNGVYEPMANGPWELKYTLRYEDSSVNVPVSGLSVKSESGIEYRITKAVLSPIGLHIDANALADYDDIASCDDFTVSLLMKDGTISDVQCDRGYGSFLGTVNCSFEAMFSIPIQLDNIEALVICGENVAINTI